jgi:putative transcriptional regulator
MTRRKTPSTPSESCADRPRKRLARGRKAKSSGEAADFSHQFLLATPTLEDDHFRHSVTLLCEHSEKGALGIVVNRPLTLQLGDMLDQIGVPRDQLKTDCAVFWGGPLQPERGFVVHTAPSAWESTIAIGDDLFLTTSRDVLAAIGRGKGPRRYIVALGYAGWGEGQLEEEIMRNAWLNTPVDREVLFDVAAEERWIATGALLGIDVRYLAAHVGHA